jgi:hypothetical protein
LPVVYLASTLGHPPAIGAILSQSVIIMAGVIKTVFGEHNEISANVSDIGAHQRHIHRGQVMADRPDAQVAFRIARHAGDDFVNTRSVPRGRKQVRVSVIDCPQLINVEPIGGRCQPVQNGANCGKGGAVTFAHGNSPECCLLQSWQHHAPLGQDIAPNFLSAPASPGFGFSLRSYAKTCEFHTRRATETNAPFVIVKRSIASIESDFSHGNWISGARSLRFRAQY